MVGITKSPCLMKTTHFLFAAAAALLLALSAAAQPKSSARKGPTGAASPSS